MCKGKAAYKPTPGLEERMHVVMTSKKEVLHICQKKDVPGLFTKAFWDIYSVWQYYHYGMGLPVGKNYTEHDTVLINCVVAMEAHYQHEFSQEAVIILYLEATIKNIQQLAKITAKK